MHPRSQLGSISPVHDVRPQLRIPPFWVLQLVGWLVYTIGLAVSSIPVWRHGQSVLFRIVLLVSSFLCCLPLHAICRVLWKRQIGLLSSLAICGAVAIPMGVFISAVTLWAEQVGGNVNINFSMSYVLVYMSNGAVLLMAWSGLYFGIKHFQRAEAERARALLSASFAREAQLRALRFQLQPHFLFNTLNAISTLVLDEQPTQAVQMITRLSDLLRSTLQAPETHQIPLSSELETAREYLRIEEVRFGDRLRTVVDVESDALGAEVPRLLLQPLLENAIRHGIAQLAEGGTIVVQSFVSGPVLTVKVSNDVPRSTAIERTRPEEIGIGIANTRERLTTFYGDSASFHAALGATGQFDATIQLPFRPAQVRHASATRTKVL